MQGDPGSANEQSPYAHVSFHQLAPHEVRSIALFHRQLRPQIQVTGGPARPQVSFARLRALLQSLAQQVGFQAAPLARTLAVDSDSGTRTRRPRNFPRARSSVLPGRVAWLTS